MELIGLTDELDVGVKGSKGMSHNALFYCVGVFLNNWVYGPLCETPGPKCDPDS